VVETEIKVEADSNDITEHRHDDKSGSYLCTVCDKQFTMWGYWLVGEKTRTYVVSVTVGLYLVTNRIAVRMFECEWMTASSIL